MQTLFILPELQDALGLTVLFLADGNRRSSTSGGYAGGARRVVSIAEHLARRPDVAAMVACILSPDNIAKRGDGFFAALHREFIHLGVDIETRGALVAAGVRLEIAGDLGPLRARGGHALALADAIEAVAEMTRGVKTPDLRLALGVGYGRDTARELGADLIVRTGMEEPGVLRLSGLGTGAHIVHCATTTLWPDVEPREVDEIIDRWAPRPAPRFAAGHDLAVIVELASALSRADIGSPIHVTITTDATPAAVAEERHHLYAGPSCELRIVHGPEHAGGDRCSVLAPGQRPPRFVLPDWPPPGHANIHACEPDAAGLLQGIREALRFSAAHPPLLGSERATVRAEAPEAAPRAPGKIDRDALADRFAAKTLAWAESAGLLISGAEWRRAAFNYALTAFFIHHRIPTEWDEAGAEWEQRADLTARYMLLVAAGDEGVFDRLVEGETAPERWARIEASARFLQSTLRSEGPRARPPRVHGAEFLAAIAEGWRALLDRHGTSCHPAAAAGFLAGLEDLYAASVAEHRAGLASHEERWTGAPPSIVAKARAADTNERRALRHLAEVAGSIGAGLLFRTAALAAPAACVTSEGIAALEAAATVLDYHVRLSNDVSGFLGSPGGDRDPKENACTLLVPAAASGPARAAAIVQALATCRRLAAWLDGEISARFDHVAAVWPSMGVILRRGALIGRRVYEVGHYTTVSRAEMSAIIDEVEDT